MNSLYFSNTKSFPEKLHFKPTPKHFNRSGLAESMRDCYVKQPPRLLFGKMATTTDDALDAWFRYRREHREERIEFVGRIIKEEIEYFKTEGRSTVALGNILLIDDYEDIAEEVLKRFKKEIEELRRFIHRGITEGEMKVNERICKELVLKRRFKHPDIFMAKALETPEMKAFLQECRQRRKGKDPVLVVVGSGPVPFTAIQAAIKGLTVIGLDNDLDAYKASRRLLSNLHLDPSLGSKVKNRIRVRYRDGANYDYRNADLVYVVPILSPENQLKIFERICQCRRAEHKRVMTVLPHHTLLQINLHTVPKNDLERLFQEMLTLHTTYAVNKPVLLTPRELCSTG
jgi:hypothetical protein